MIVPTLCKELICIRLSHGFVKYTHSSNRLEEIGWFYMSDQQGDEEEEEKDIYGEKNPLSKDIFFSTCGVSHDSATMVSRNECAAIDVYIALC